MKKRQLWEERIKEQRLSGLTQKQWCDEKGFTVSGLRYWIQRTKKEDLEKKVSDSKDSELPLSFAGIIIAPDSQAKKSEAFYDRQSEAIEIKVGDLVCSVFPKFTESHLLRVIRTLKRA